MTRMKMRVLSIVNGGPWQQPAANVVTKDLRFEDKDKDL